jgi:hypothetical protein
MRKNFNGLFSGGALSKIKNRAIKTTREKQALLSCSNLNYYYL